jgi:predicted metalloprotease with PDZ domain
MSFLAPFNDAAKSIDETNFGNIFISYYSYGEMLGLALDLSLREKNLNLDDLHQTLNEYAGKEFGDTFFNNYIYKSGMPDYKTLFSKVGVILEAEDEIDFGATLTNQKIMSNPKFGSAAYASGLQKGDKIIRVGLIFLEGSVSINSILNNFKIGETVPVIFERFGVRKETMLTIKTEIKFYIKLMNTDSNELTADMKRMRASWLESKL